LEQVGVAVGEAGHDDSVATVDYPSRVVAICGQFRRVANRNDSVTLDRDPTVVDNALGGIDSDDDSTVE
jgi:hypothetical protein